MEKTTVLAKLTLTLRFSDATLRWLQELPDSWAAKEEGSVFLAEFGHTWEKLFLEAADEEFRAYFAKLGLPRERLPFVQVAERYRGSWILAAYLVMTGTVSTSYAILKGISELPKIAEGLSVVKAAIQRRVGPLLDRAVRDQLILTLDLTKPRLELSLPQPQTRRPLPPQTVLHTDFALDARPLSSLSPVVQSHKMHMSVGISRGGLTLENLDDEDLRRVRLGLFRAKSERNQWSYAESYMASLDLLSGHQTVSMKLGEFRDAQRNAFDMSDGEAAYVDCWVQDDNGIYLFRFFLQEE